MKHISILAFLFAISTHAHADSFIPYKGGKLVLYALPGCGGPKEPHSMMYGFWQKSVGHGEVFCWKYDEAISIYYIEGKVLLLPAEDVVTEHDDNVDDQPATDKHRKFPAKLSQITINKELDHPWLAERNPPYLMTCLM